MSEINNIKPPLQPGVNPPRNVAERGNRAAEETPVTAAPNTEQDKVSLTDTATQLQALQQTVADLPEVDKARVDAIKAAIEDGSYQIDSKELARKMIDFEGDF